MEDNIILDADQEQALTNMINHDHWGLFWDVGKGKTPVLLKRLALFTHKRILILAPAVVVKDMWSKEEKLDRFNVFASNEVEIHSFEWLGWRSHETVITKYGKKRVITKSHRNDLKHSQYDVVIIDEASILISPNSNISRFVRNITAKANYVYCLTGTATRKSNADLFYLFRNAHFSIWQNFENYDEFVRYYFVGFNMKIGSRGSIFKIVKMKPNLESRFMDEISHCCEFGTKTRAYELEDVHDIAIKPTISDYYNLAKENIAVDINGKLTMTLPLQQAFRLNMLINGFEYKLNKDGVNQAIKYFDNPKLAVLLRLIKHELKARDAIMVAYTFMFDFDEISRMLTNNGILFCSNHDEADALKRDNKKFVYLIQIRRGIGNNMQDLTSCLVYYTYDGSYEHYVQTAGRIDRRGQVDNVRIYRLYFSKSIEYDVYIKALDNRINVADYLKTTYAKKYLAGRIK